MFASGNNITLTESEKSFLLETVKEDYPRLLYGDADPIFRKLKEILSKENYEKIYILYYEYKEKYKNYL